MKNKISDLNNVLFEQIERINDDDLTPEQLEKELRKGQAINEIAKTIIDNGRLVIQAQKILGDLSPDKSIDMEFLGVNDD